jgi:type IV secretion system protein VirB9
MPTSLRHVLAAALAVLVAASAPAALAQADTGPSASESETIVLASGATATVAAPGPDGGLVGDGFTSGSVVVTSAQMEEALGELVAEYERTGRAGVLRQSTVMVFPFGHSQPVLAAAPLRASVIELQEGEAVLGVVAGDTERFAIEQTQTGPGGRVPLVVVKPLAHDVTTNLVISTDRRVYHVTLDSAPAPRRRSRRGRRAGEADRGRSDANPQTRYARHIRFYYPDDALAASAAEFAARVIEPERSDLASVADLSFAYQTVGDREARELVSRVFDDGRHTYVQLDPARLRGGTVPVLYVQGPSGEREILNYAYDDGTYVTDRTADVMELVLGATVRKGFLGLGGTRQVERSVRILRVGE